MAVRRWPPYRREDRRGAVLTVAPNDFTHLHVHSEFSLLDGLGRINGAGRRRPSSSGSTRSRSPTTARSTAPSRSTRRAADAGHQADHRRRDVRRAPVDDRPRGQGRREALPPDPARARLDRLPEPVPPGHRRAPRRLLLQAAHRPRLPRPALARALSGCRRVSAARSRARSRPSDGTRRGARRRPTATSWARATSSSSCRTTACPSSAG